MNKKKKINSISIVIPIYKDKNTVTKMITSSLRILKKTINNYEVIAIDDGCPDKSGHEARKFFKDNKKVKVIFHKENLGYGAAIKTGFRNSKYDCVFAIDGDGEYDVNVLPQLKKKLKNSDLVITRRYKKQYNTWRSIVSWTYNFILRLLFNINYRDISSGSRLVRKELINKIKINTNSPFLGAELTIKATYFNYKVREHAIYYYPSDFRSGASVSLKNILLTIKDMLILYFKWKK